MVVVFFLVNEMVQVSENIETGRYFVRERGKRENKTDLETWHSKKYQSHFSPLIGIPVQRESTTLARCRSKIT